MLLFNQKPASVRSTNRSAPQRTVVVITAALLLALSFGTGSQAAPADGLPPQKPGQDFTVKLTKRFEVADHRGRLCPDGKTLIVERWDSTGQMRMLDARTGKELYAFDKEPRAFDLLPDGRSLTALITEYRSPDKPPKGQKEFKGEARYYQEMKVWDLAKPQAPRERLVIPDASRPVFSPDGRWLLVVCQEQGQPLRWDLWGLEKGKRLARFPVKQANDYWPAFSPDGALLAIPDPEAVRLYELPDGKELRALEHKSSRPPSGDVSCVLSARGNTSSRSAFAPDGKTLATSGDDGKVKLWDVATGKLSATLEGHSQPYTFLRYSPDGNLLVTGSIGVKEVLRVAPGLPGKPPVTAKATIIDPSVGEVLVWDARTRTKQQTLPIHCPRSLSWSPDGKILAVGDESGSAAGKPPVLQLWDALQVARWGRGKPLPSVSLPPTARRCSPSILPALSFGMWRLCPPSESWCPCWN
jgi:WD40 repeat protein